MEREQGPEPAFGQTIHAHLVVHGLGAGGAQRAPGRPQLHPAAGRGAVDDGGAARQGGLERGRVADVAGDNLQALLHGDARAPQTEPRQRRLGAVGGAAAVGVPNNSSGITRREGRRAQGRKGGERRRRWRGQGGKLGAII